MDPHSHSLYPRDIRAALEELDRQVEQGEWSGLRSASGAPIYTLREIAEAVIRELRKEPDDSGGHRT